MLLRMLASTAERHGERPALLWCEGSLTYAELVGAVHARAAAFEAEGLAPGRAVALLLPNGPDFAIDFFAIAACGAVAIPLNPQFKVDEITACLQGCEPALLVCDRTTASVGRAAAKRIGGEARVQERLGAPPAPVLRDRRAEPWSGDVLHGFSSGSTGTPKRVVRSQANLVSESEHFTRASALGPSDVILGVVPFHHSHGLGNCLLAAARSGARLVIEASFEPRRALATIVRERVTILPGVPFIFRMLAEVRSPKHQELGSLRLCFSAGAALPAAVFEAFDERFGIPVRQLYGCSEAGSLTLNLDPDAAGTAGSSGLPLGDVSIAIVDARGEPCPLGEVGEVVITSPALGRSSDASASQGDGAFRTGDLGALDPRGRLTLHGRKKLFISTPAGKVDPVEVERCLAQHPRVEEVVVVGVPARGGEEVVKAVVVARAARAEGEIDADPATLRRELVGLAREQLAEFKVPRRVEIRDEIPRSPLGKVLRKYLV